MFGRFSSASTLGVFQIHYCNGAYGNCERYKRASKGVMPSSSLLPDGTYLQVRVKRK